MGLQQKLPAALTVGLAAMALAATSRIGYADPVANAASSTVTYPADSLTSLDPIAWGGQVLPDQGTLFEGLFGYNSKNQIVPKIADKWKVSDHGFVWTIWMRHNARWSNGKPVTAQDFAYAWLRNAAPSNTVDDTWASVVSDVPNESEYHAGGVPASAVGINVVNDYELKITLSTAVNIDGLLALAGSMPLYPQDVEAHSSNWYLPQYFVGDGPYVVHSCVTNGELEMIRNRDYVGATGQENVGNVQQIDLIPEPPVPVEDVESNALDAAVVTSPSDYQYAEEHLKSEIHKAPEANIMYLGWDHSVDASPLNNSWARDAIAMAINRAPISDPVLNNMAGPTSIFGYPGFPTDANQSNPFGFNLGQGRKLLTKAGYPDGKGIGTLYLNCQTTTNSPQSVLIAESVAQQLKTNLNIHFKVEPVNSTL